MTTENELPADEPVENPAETIGAEAAAAAADAQRDAEADIAREAEAEALDSAEDPSGETDGDASAAEDDAPDLAAEVQDLKDKLLRTMAEMENTRRIAAREKADAGKYAVTNFARDIVRVADNLGMAMMSVSEEAREADQNLNNLYVGIDMTMKELLNIFAGHGIKPVPAEGQPFDHNIHEAVQQLENPDVPHNTVLQVLRGGFTLQDRLLRPAQVIVSTGGPKADKDASEEAAADVVPDGAQQAYEGDGVEPGQTVDQET